MSSENTSDAAQKSKMRLPYLIFSLCFLIGLVLIPSLSEKISYSINRGVQRAKREAAEKFLQTVPNNEYSIPWIVQMVEPSVVSIQTSQYNQESGNNTGIATGVIVDAQQGLIITNFHVICDGRQLVDGVEIHLSDGRRQADGIELLGFDEQHDIAVLKVHIGNLTAISWGNSDLLEVGESIVAIGNPYGLTHSATSGIVSAKERLDTLPNGQIVQEYLQTDAATNPGNSGGPMVNRHGELVGINTAIFGQQFQGISFAIPSNLVREVYNRIVAPGVKESRVILKGRASEPRTV